ncbi:cytochrome b N-terminal domain-containing protein [Devosia sp. J2-20]|jgi:quinol-cytochrome oxidoreductase complex cytochrome b subunit|uniref:Cytochrome b n=1 Tax=Devosia litorisediminis TaxID=2829817 RepID=A0A942E8V3_9HYPH|nr:MULTISPECIES: cytochrome b N-terminal domain-containing protein [Devosia]MBS3847485.1 cytochrome b N-terminal domain-containing protein [Devosia litorisediminis]MCZ4347154.1 cytochrome b N-terminal domain-containing protein [Devosia neptuniae]WDQ99394.1 cytochrome b N-terminal domain-containing protein [Devosia sp. J2-20]|tara:strand:+ start:40987 stop:42237 length:1251 start_codon:yes stop_codon:yes gene_type:complete
MSEHSTYTPGSGLEKWLDERLPIIRFSKEHLMDFPTPKNLNYFWTFGAILVMCLGIQIVTGVILAMHYTPNVAMAFDSVEHIRRDVNGGRMIQSFHAVGASMFFAAVYIHIFRGMYFGSYKAPREILWILGVLIFVLMMATAFMGYVLPWGQMSGWAATVITNIFAAIPVIGTPLLELLRGGFSVGNPTLNRFFSLHYLLPFVIAAVVALHIWALHVPGNNNPTGVDVKSSRDTLPFHPYYTMKDAFGMVLFLIPFAWFAFFAPDILGHPDNYIQFNSQVTPAHIVPEWYFLPFYAILRAIDFNILFIDSKLGGVIFFGGSIVILFLLPWLDTSKVRSGNFRPMFKWFYWLFVVNFVALTYLGAAPAEGIYVVLAKLCTAYYFIHFIVILPVLSRIEKPRPLPTSISESVLAKSHA